MELLEVLGRGLLQCRDVDLILLEDGDQRAHSDDQISSTFQAHSKHTSQVYLWSRKSCWIHTLKVKTLSFSGRVPALCLARVIKILINIIKYFK